MIKKILASSIICLLLIFLHISVKAATFTDNQVVDTNKSWTIHFNQEVELDDLTKSGIVVTDSKGNVANVTLTLGSDNKSVIVNAPTGGYVAEESYTLTVGKKAHSNNGKSLDQDVVEHFSIEKKKLTKDDIAVQRKSMVTIYVYDGNNNRIGGSYGFIISSDGKIVTTLHEMKGGSCAKVVLNNGTQQYDVQGIYGYDKTADIAILKINAKDLPTVSLGDSNSVKIGDNIFDLGSPKDDTNTHVGKISELANSQIRAGYKDFKLNMDDKSYSPDSGSPLFNEYGEVVGIGELCSEAGYSSSNIAIPINDVKKFMNDTTLNTFNVVSNSISNVPDTPNTPSTPSTPSIPTNPSTPVNTVKYFPLLSDVPQPKGMNYIKGYESGNIAAYYYDISQVPNDFLVKYPNLLITQGWRNYITGDSDEGIFYVKGSNMIRIQIVLGYFVISGNIH